MPRSAMLTFPRRLASGAVFFASLAVAAGDAWAACDNFAPASGSIVTCSGASTQPVIAVTGSGNVAVNVLAGATITAMAGLVLQGTSVVGNAGTISVSGGGVGIVGRLDDNALTNLAGGIVQATGASTSAIGANGNRNTLRNLGLVTTQNGNAYGLAILTFPGNTLRDNVLLNEGTIRTLGPASHAVFAEQNDRATLTNSGLIDTRGNNASGLRAVGGSNVLLNRATVQTAGTDANAVYIQGNNNSVRNEGRLETTGANAEAVFSNTAGASFVANIVNAPGATISSTQSLAIRGLNGQEIVVNEGTIASGAGTAMALGGGNDQVILRTGSLVQGSIDGGTGSDLVRLEGSGTAGNAFVNVETLRMDGQAWTFSGSGSFDVATLASGVFTLSGVLSAPTTVLPSATLTGGGRVGGNLTVQGTVRPGVTPGTGVLTVAGNYTHAPGAVLEVTQGPTSADRIDVGGTATLQGGAVRVLAQQAGTYNTGRVPIVTAAGGVSGTFDSLQLPTPLLSETALDYDANNAYLSVTRRASFASAAAPGNQAQVAAVLDAIEPVATGSLGQAAAEIALLPTQPQVAAAFDALSGSVYPSFAAIGLREQGDFARALTQRLAEQRGGLSVADAGLSCSGAGCETAVWARAFGTEGRYGSAALSSSSSIDTRRRGVAMGADRALSGASRHVRVGGAIEMARLDADFRSEPVHAQADSARFGIFGSVQFGDNYVAGVASYGRWRGDLDRQIVIGGLARQARGRIRADVASASLEAGRHIDLGNTTIEPIATLSYTHLRQKPFSEQGAGEVGLDVARQKLESLQAGLGLRVRHGFAVGNGRLEVEGRARWLRELDSRRATATMAFVGAPFNGFEVSGVPLDRNLKLLGAGLSYVTRGGLTTQLVYESTVGGNDRLRSVMLRLRQVW